MHELYVMTDSDHSDVLPARPGPVIPLLSYQRADIESTARFNWSCWSRQTGKSFAKSLRRILRGLVRRRNQLFLSAGERQSRELMLKVQQHCRALQITAESRTLTRFQDTDFRGLEVRLPGGVRIIGLPANPETVRGFTGDVFLDEFAMHSRDREIWAAMFPALLRGRGELDVASTPKGKSNMFYELSKNSAFRRTTVTLHDAVAAGLNVDADDIQHSMGDDELFRQEFLCEFLDESTAFLTYEHITACQNPLLLKTRVVSELAEPKRDLFIGLDIGRHRDLTVFWILSRVGQRYTTEAVFELSNKPFRVQFELLSRLMNELPVRQCAIDSGGLGMQLAESAVEAFGGHRVRAVTFTNAVKNQLAGALRIVVEEQRIEIPADVAIRDDWHSVRRDVSASGLFVLRADRSGGSHADRFWAAALALHAASHDQSGTIESIGISPLAFAREGVW
jgi:phage FluMu gp28-like protein